MHSVQCLLLSLSFDISPGAGPFPFGLLASYGPHLVDGGNGVHAAVSRLCGPKATARRSGVRVGSKRTGGATTGRMDDLTRTVWVGSLIELASAVYAVLT